MQIILDRIRVCNTDPEPEMLIIHCPREMQVARWCDWAAEIAAYLEREGWTRRVEHEAVHMICPMHPARMQ